LSLDHPAISLANSLRAPLPDAEAYIIRTSCRCPSCHALWRYETLGTAAPAQQSPLDLGPALLCGTCEARRRLYVLVDGVAVPLWRDEDARQMWAILYAADRGGDASYWPVHTVLDDADLWRDLASDKDEALRRILYARNGQRRSIVSHGLIQALGLNWSIPLCPAEAA
jgi:hypothetical protein